MTHHQVLLQLRAAQVEDAVLQPQLLGGELLALAASDRDRRRHRWPDHTNRRAAHFDIAQSAQQYEALIEELVGTHA